MNRGHRGRHLLPFAIPDRWIELREDEAGAPPDEAPEIFPFDEMEGLSNLPDGWWDPDDTYDAFYTQGGQSGDPLPGTPGVGRRAGVNGKNLAVSLVSCRCTPNTPAK